MNPNIKKFEKRLKIKIKNKSLLIEALTHKSANHEINNERLEFLGDRVIGLVLSNKLFDIYPKETEGVLDKRFAKLVNRKTCASIAWSIGVKDFILAKTNCSYVRLVTFKQGLKVLSACLTVFLEPSMVNSTPVVQYQGGIFTTTGTLKMSVTPLTTVLTLPVYCELIASALGFE